MNQIIDDNTNIEDMIYEIRGKQVMLASDLARLYKCTNGTKTINLAVKRHVNRFPERFMFQLTSDKYRNLRFQFETSSLENDYGGRRYNPYVFAEQGVAMLATVLKTEASEEVSINRIGYKTFSITMIGDKEVCNLFFNKVNKII